MEQGNTSIVEGRPSVIKSSKDEYETPLTKCPSISAPYDNSFDHLNHQQTSEHSSRNLDHSSQYIVENSSSTSNDQEHSPDTPSTSRRPVNISAPATSPSSSPSTSSSTSSKKAKFQCSEAERKVYPCEHSGCGKKYTN